MVCNTSQLWTLPFWYTVAYLFPAVQLCRCVFCSVIRCISSYMTSLTLPTICSFHFFGRFILWNFGTAFHFLERRSIFMVFPRTVLWPEVPAFGGFRHRGLHRLMLRHFNVMESTFLKVLLTAFSTVLYCIVKCIFLFPGRFCNGLGLSIGRY